MHTMKSDQQKLNTRLDAKAQNTPPTDADATQLSSWVASAVWTHPWAVVTQFAISYAVELLRFVTSDGIMTSLLKKLTMLIKIHVVKNVKPLCSLFGQFPNCRPNPPAVIVNFANSCTHRRRRRDATRQFRRVGGVHLILVLHKVV